MKIIMLRSCLILLTVLIQVSSIAQLPKETDIIGTYYLSMDDMELGEEQKQMMQLMVKNFKIELKKDGELKVEVMDKKETGTYILTGTELEMVVQGDAQKATLIDDKITIAIPNMGESIVLKKSIEVKEEMVEETVEKVETNKEQLTPLDENNLIGSYSLFLDDMELSDEDKKLIEPMAVNMKLEVLNDGKYKLSVFSESEEGTYIISGSQIHMTSTEGIQKGEIEGDKITFDDRNEDGALLVFKKD